MHFDPYESKRSKRRRITSNIAIAVIIAMMLCGIYYLIFSNSKMPRYEFERLELDAFSISELNDGKSEFDNLNSVIKESKNILFDKSFKEKYPTASSLLMMDKSVYNSDKPFAVVGGGYVTLAQCVVSTQTDCRDLAVTMIKLQGSTADNSLTLNMSDITEYTVRYNTRDAHAPLIYLSSGKAIGINIFKINLTVENGTLKDSHYKLTLNHEFDEERAKAKLYHQIVFDPANNSYHSPAIKSGEKATYISIKPIASKVAGDKTFAKYQINLNSKTINLFESVDFKYSVDNADQSKISISFN